MAAFPYSYQLATDAATMPPAPLGDVQGVFSMEEVRTWFKVKLIYRDEGTKVVFLTMDQTVASGSKLPSEVMGFAAGDPSLAVTVFKPAMPKGLPRMMLTGGVRSLGLTEADSDVVQTWGKDNKGATEDAVNPDPPFTAAGVLRTNNLRWYPYFRKKVMLSWDTRRAYTKNYQGASFGEAGNSATDPEVLLTLLQKPWGGPSPTGTGSSTIVSNWRLHEVFAKRNLGEMTLDAWYVYYDALNDKRLAELDATGVNPKRVDTDDLVYIQNSIYARKGKLKRAWVGRILPSSSDREPE